MEQIIIQVRDKETAVTLKKLLSTLDYIESIHSESEPAEPSEDSSDIQSDDFFATAGMWQDRDVTLDSLRQKAWPRQIK